MSDRWVITVPFGLSSCNEVLGIQVGDVRTRERDEPSTHGKTAMQMRDALIRALARVGIRAHPRGQQHIVIDTNDPVQLYGGPGMFSVERERPLSNRELGLPDDAVRYNPNLLLRDLRSLAFDVPLLAGLAPEYQPSIRVERQYGPDGLPLMTGELLGFRVDRAGRPHGDFLCVRIKERTLAEAQRVVVLCAAFLAHANG